MKPRVHPKVKTKYRVGNWAEYDRALVRRGNILNRMAELPRPESYAIGA